MGERPLHTRKVAGSIPAGTTTTPLLDASFFAGVNKDVGEIIVTDVTAARIAELLAPDRTALQKLIRKQN